MLARIAVFFIRYSVINLLVREKDDYTKRPKRPIFSN